MIEIQIDSSAVTAAFNRLLALGEDMTPVMRAISKTLKDATEQNFAAQAGPLGAWLALKDKKRASGKILQDTGRLAASIAAAYDSQSASVGTNVIYAAIHQLGGDIDHPAYSIKQRLRTDAKGNLLRQEGHKNLAVFAKGSHKRAREVVAEHGAHTTHIPARPYLPVTPDGNLQDGVADEIADILRSAVQNATGAA